MLKTKNILVVGACGLLGSALIEGLLNAGAAVVASDLDLEKLKSTFGHRVQAGQNISLQELDITNKFNLVSLLADQQNLDGAVNCSYPRNKNYGATFFDVNLDDFNANIALHLGSHFQFMQVCAAKFKEDLRPFSLVNIASIYGVVAPKFEIYDNTKMTMPVEYAAIKSALIHISKYTAAYIADSRFRVNCVSPGGLLDRQPDTFLNAYKSQTFGQGMLGAADIVGAIMFLLSDHSKFINGQNIVVDDGFCL